jgi:hypothetical protein
MHNSNNSNVDQQMSAMNWERMHQKDLFIISQTDGKNNIKKELNGG